MSKYIRKQHYNSHVSLVELMKDSNPLKRTRAELLVAGMPFRGYVGMVAHGFETCGMKVSVLEWTTPARDPVELVKLYLSRDYRLKAQEIQNQRNSTELEEAIMRSAPNYVLVLKGARITDKARNFCDRQGIKLIMWAYDSASHVPVICESAPDYDLVYVYEPADLQMFSHCGNAKFLPLAYDPRLYHPSDVDKGSVICDVCFVGNLSGYPQRRALLKRVADRFPDRKIIVWSDTRFSYSPLKLEDLFIVGGRSNLELRRQTADHVEINNLYNKARVCLNIHHLQARSGVNPRSFEILGSGAFLLTDMKLDGIGGFKDGKDYVSYSSAVDLEEKIAYYIQGEDDRVSIAESGRREAERNHTYSCRAHRVLRDLE